MIFDNWDWVKTESNWQTADRNKKLIKKTKCQNLNKTVKKILVKSKDVKNPSVRFFFKQWKNFSSNPKMSKHPSVSFFKQWKKFSSNRAVTQMILVRCVSEEPLPFHCLTFEIPNILLISLKIFPKNQVICALIMCRMSMIKSIECIVNRASKINLVP